jgi:hypothetical protein
MPNFSSEFASTGYGGSTNAAMNPIQQMIMASMDLGGGMIPNSYGYQQQQQMQIQQKTACFASMVHTLLMTFSLAGQSYWAQRQAQ